MMKDENLSSSFVKFTISLSLIFMFVAPVLAVEEWRESQLNGGWQIWIEAANFDRRDENKVIKLAEEVPDLAKNAPEGLTGDFIIAPGPQKTGFNEYDFESPHEGDAFIYCRVMDYRGGGQSWWVGLNCNEDTLLDDEHYVKVSTTADWEWKTRPNMNELKEGTNTMRIVPREAAADGMEILMEIFMVSTVDFTPTDDDFNNAKQTSAKALQPQGTLAIRWGTLKSD